MVGLLFKVLHPLEVWSWYRCSLDQNRPTAQGCHNTHLDFQTPAVLPGPQLYSPGVHSALLSKAPREVTASVMLTCPNVVRPPSFQCSERLNHLFGIKLKVKTGESFTFQKISLLGEDRSEPLIGVKDEILTSNILFNLLPASLELAHFIIGMPIKPRETPN